MLLDGWLGFAVSLFSIACGIAGLSWGLAVSQGLRRRTLSLEYDVADLQERLLREIKSRAGKLGAKSRTDDAELESAILEKAKTPNNQTPWWWQHVHPDLKNT